MKQGNNRPNKVLKSILKREKNISLVFSISFFVFCFCVDRKAIIFNPIPADQSSGENNRSKMAGKSKPKPLNVYLYIPNIIGEFSFEISVWILSLIFAFQLGSIVSVDLSFLWNFDVLENRNNELESRTEFCVLFVESNVASFWFLSLKFRLFWIYFSIPRQYLSYFWYC